MNPCSRQQAGAAALTIHPRLRSLELPQCDQLFHNLSLPVYQHRRRVLLRVPLDAQVRADFAELEVTEFRRRLSPQLREHAGLDIPTR